MMIEFEHPPLAVRWLGRLPYAEAWALQQRLVAAIADGEAPDTLLLVEHDPVVTLGRKRGAADNLLDVGDLPVFEVERGGDATYHGPGQLVGYPLLALREGERDLHVYLRNLEAVLIDVLAGYGIEASRRESWTGVWVQERKLASVGVAVKRWVTYHGFALNVSTDLAAFHRMNPCGLPAGVMAGISDWLGSEAPSVAAVAQAVASHFPVTFGRRAHPDPESLPWPPSPATILS